MFLTSHSDFRTTKWKDVFFPSWKDETWENILKKTIPLAIKYLTKSKIIL